MQGFFIAGTDSGCGKTHVCAALLRDFRARGVPAVGCMPVSCGDRRDARLLRDAMGAPAQPLDLVNPVHLRTVAAPLMAATAPPMAAVIWSYPGAMSVTSGPRT